MAVTILWRSCRCRGLSFCSLHLPPPLALECFLAALLLGVDLSLYLRHAELAHAVDGLPIKPALLLGCTDGRDIVVMAGKLIELLFVDQQKIHQHLDSLLSRPRRYSAPRQKACFYFEPSPLSFRIAYLPCLAPQSYGEWRWYPNSGVHLEQLAGALGRSGEAVRQWAAGEAGIKACDLYEVARFLDDPALIAEIYGDLGLHAEAAASGRCVWFTHRGTHNAPAGHADFARRFLGLPLTVPGDAATYAMRNCGWVSVEMRADRSAVLAYDGDVLQQHMIGTTAGPSLHWLRGSIMGRPTSYVRAAFYAGPETGLIITRSIVRPSEEALAA